MIFLSLMKNILQKNEELLLKMNPLFKKSGAIQYLPIRKLKGYSITNPMKAVPLVTT